MKNYETNKMIAEVIANKLRLSGVKDLFKNKTHTGEITSRVGYKKLSTFIEAFKSIVGMKMKKYRDKYC